MNSGFDGMLKTLAQMPDFLRSAASRFDKQSERRRGPDNGFSFVEQVLHLADLEREGFGERIRRLRTEERPGLGDFDGARVARERQYRSREVAEGIAAFTAAREANLASFRTLGAAEWEFAGNQEGVGEVRLRDLPRMMAEHDASHRAEIEELLEPGAGTKSTKPLVA